MKLKAVLCLALGLFTTQSQALAQKELDNGLKVIVKVDNRSPMAVSQVWYRVGSADEPRGLTGMAHALEHMMFLGTPEISREQFVASLNEMGGRFNAFTNTDYTAYYEEVGIEHLEKAFKLEADRMQHLLLPADAVAKEMQVVMEERRLRVEDNPQALAFERFQSLAHTNGPYHHPVIGWFSDLEGFERENFVDWYQQFYAPNNATLVVVGDVDPDAVFAMAEKTFGDIPSRELPKRFQAPDARLDGPKRAEFFFDLQVPYLLMGYDTPALSDESTAQDALSLWVLSEILSGQDSARLPRVIMRQDKTAVSVGASYNPMKRYPGQFYFYAVPAPGQTLETVEQAIAEQIKALQEEPVSKTELARVKAGVIADFVFEKDMMRYHAMALGVAETVGVGASVIDELPKRLEQVTPQMVKAAAQKYLTPERLTVTHNLPKQKAPDTVAQSEEVTS